MIEETKTTIRRLVINETLNNTPKQKITAKVEAVLKNALVHIHTPRLKKATASSLLSFYKRQLKSIEKVLTNNEIKNAILFYVSNGDKVGLTKARAELFERGFNNSRQLGVPLKMYNKDYTQKLVKPLIDTMAEMEAVDPDDISGRNSLRNRAEMEIRYQGHQNNIEELKSKGCKLVVASSHADCSERCSPYQGRVFSLDGTIGETDDGRRFIPLETATDIYYTTKRGVRYKNGLLGFNCRHYLTAYKSGEKQTMPSLLMQKREREITAQQREYERRIRQAKAVQETAKNLDRITYTQASRKVKQLTQDYKEYSLKHNRAYYPYRIRVI